MLRLELRLRLRLRLRLKLRLTTDATALRYYPPFAAAVEAGVGSVMCSYNKINTFWSCENNVTLHELKNALGFRGWVMSDWVSRHNIADIFQQPDAVTPGC